MKALIHRKPLFSQAFESQVQQASLYTLVQLPDEIDLYDLTFLKITSSNSLLTTVSKQITLPSNAKQSTQKYTTEKRDLL
jgi:hypothetical protein